MLCLKIASGCGPTGHLLESLLDSRGVLRTSAAEPHSGVVCWGAPYTGSTLPALNRRAGVGDKFQQLDTIGRAGVPIPSWAPISRWREAALPILVRRAHHVGGRDIRLVKTRKGLEYWSTRRDFLVSPIANDREFRVWVYRGRHLGTYEKVRTRPPKREGMFGRNYDNGYSFQLVPSAGIPREAVALAVRSVEALDLDFGAVDIIRATRPRSEAERYVVLEVNTAPGVESEARQAIRLLADHIAKWHRGGHKRRSGDVNEG